MITALPVVEKLKAQFADAVQEVTEAYGELTVVVRQDRIVEICRVLKTDADLRYDLLLDMAGVDYLGREPRFEVVYHLYSLPYNSRLRLKVRV
ncbi:MAG TPA: NADH-quinone oxidoreductase subunit C, partial [Gammaproteobacteria bacterium]|nr:NADH-quinone oxidoreductase subunit C [Gammaproteobacteria bacterium]